MSSSSSSSSSSINPDTYPELMTMSSAGFEVSQPTLHAEHMHYHSNLAASMARQHKRVKITPLAIYIFVLD